LAVLLFTLVGSQVNAQCNLTINTKKDTAYLDSNGVAAFNSTFLNNGSTSNCTIDSMWLDIDSLYCLNLGVNIVTLFAQASVTTNSATDTILVLDTIKPILNCYVDTTIWLNNLGIAILHLLILRQLTIVAFILGV
jgi:hypothetical protein